MPGRRITVYYAWSRPDETGAPLGVIENRFPTLFESRRMLFPKFEALADPARYDQGVAGFLDHIMRENFVAFVEQARAETGAPVTEIERVDAEGRLTPLDAALAGDVDTLILIGFDSLRSAQAASAAEIAAVRGFLAHTDHLVFVSPHHDIGEVPDLPHDARISLQQADFLHHGDKTIPPQQGFGGLARSLLAGLGLPVRNRFGLRPAAEPDGAPAPIDVAADKDRLGLLEGVKTFNLHPHLPHFERIGASGEAFDVLARQKIDLAAPPHPFTDGGRTHFDALLQARPEIFPGSLLVSDATLWSSTAGGVESLSRFWSNVVQRPQRG